MSEKSQTYKSTCCKIPFLLNSRKGTTIVRERKLITMSQDIEKGA